MAARNEGPTSVGLADGGTSRSERLSNTAGRMAPVEVRRLDDPTPHASDLLVPRPRLLERLTVDPAPITVVSAPAGAGKSSLFEAMQHAADPLPTAVVTLDRCDDGLRRLWDRVLAALRELAGTDAGPDLALLRPPEAVLDPAFLDRLGDATAHLGPLRLVLDDLHLLEDPAVIDSLGLLLARRPSRWRLVLSTRRSGPLPLRRARLAGQLRELHGTDLVLDVDEVGELLARAGVRISRAAVEELHRRTEGWAAGVRIAALALREGADPDRFVGGFDGDDHAVADYLVAEVLATVPDDLHRFLLATSVCSRVDVGLASRLTGRPDAGTVLERLVAHQALTERVGRTRATYRYHELLRTYLAAERRRRRVDDVRLHRVAAAWYAERGDWAHALDHLADAELPDTFRSVLRRRGLAAALDGHDVALARLLGRVTEPLASDPSVRLTRALLSLSTHGPLALTEHLDGLDLTDLLRGRDPWLATVTAVVAVQSGAIATGAVPAGDTWIVLTTPTGDLALDLLALHHRGLGALADGDGAAAEAVLAPVTDQARAGQRDALVVSSLCLRAMAAGLDERADEAAALAGQALDHAHRRGWSGSGRVLPAHVVLTWVAALRADDEALARRLAEADGVAEQGADPRLLVALGQLRLLHRLDRGDDPRQVVQDALCSPELADDRATAPLRALVGPPLVAAAVRVGEPERARRLVDRYGAAGAGPLERRVLKAPLDLAAGRHEEVRRALEVTADDPDALAATRVAGRLLLARLELRRGVRSRAFEALHEALAVTDATGVLRPFLDLTPDVAELLAGSTDRVGRLRPVAVAAGAVAGRGGPASGDGPALTDTERRILHELPSRLSVREIAAERGVSANTVKSHLRSLYRKLDVNSRREAVELARRRGLV
jgi:LuxR family transcriptional regulator, maltose regulon positive regulatory protein